MIEVKTFPVIAQFSFVDWAELLDACHSMSKQNSPQEKSVKKHVHGLLHIIVRLKCLVNTIDQHKLQDTSNKLLSSINIKITSI